MEKNQTEAEERNQNPNPIRKKETENPMNQTLEEFPAKTNLFKSAGETLGAPPKRRRRTKEKKKMAEKRIKRGKRKLGQSDD